MVKREDDSRLELDDEFPQKHADGAFSADAMTNDIGRADNRTLSARIPSSTNSLTSFISLTDSEKYYNATDVNSDIDSLKKFCSRFN